MQAGARCRRSGGSPFVVVCLPSLFSCRSKQSDECVGVYRERAGADSKPCLKVVGINRGVWTNGKNRCAEALPFCFTAVDKQSTGSIFRLGFSGERRVFLHNSSGGEAAHRIDPAYHTWSASALHHTPNKSYKPATLVTRDGGDVQVRLAIMSTYGRMSTSRRHIAAEPAPAHPIPTMGSTEVNDIQSSLD